MAINGVVWFLNPFFFEPKEDSRQFHVLAKNLAEFGTLSLEREAPYYPSARRTPLYPMLLAGVYAVAGPEVQLVKCFQILLGPITCALTFALAATLFRNSRIALVAAALVALSPPVITFSNRLLSEGLFAALLVGATLATCVWIRRESTTSGNFFMVGILWGALALTKPEAALLPVAVIPVLLLISRRRVVTLLQVTAAMVLWMLLLTPWLARNYRIYERVCMISGQGEGESEEVGFLRTPPASGKRCVL